MWDINLFKHAESLTFYTDSNGYGSFACEVSTGLNGSPSYKLSALLKTGRETCFVAPGSSDAVCFTLEEATQHPDGEFIPDIGDMTSNIYNEIMHDRSKLENNKAEAVNGGFFSDPGFLVIELAYVADQSVMTFFYERHPGDTVSAENEATLYMTLLTNEVNVYWSTIKEASNGSLDVYVFVDTVLYPEYGTDFPYTDGNSTVNIAAGFLPNVQEFLNTTALDMGFNSRSYDYVVFLMGSQINSLPYHGTNYLVVPGVPMCIDGYVSDRINFGVARFGMHNMGRTMAQLLGSALTMDPDELTSCANGTYLMGNANFQDLFNITAETSDTYYKFSSCSYDNLITWLNRLQSHGQVGCLINDAVVTDERFEEQFCSGLPGAQDGWLDMQCHVQTGWNGSYPCSYPDGAADCYTHGSISCKTESGSCTPLRFVWQGTECGTNKMCYKGDCVDSFEVCNRTTSTSTSTSTSTTISTSTSTTKTTTTSTTTIPTTSTSSTAPTTSTTVPCNCCGIVFKRRRKTCCRRGRKRFNRSSCYCCSELWHETPPYGWTGPTRL